MCAPGRASFEAYVSIDDTPPRLKPLTFNDGPLVDFSQPPYKQHFARFIDNDLSSKKVS